MPVMYRVSSSNVRSIGYDEATKTMRVRFHNGGVYDYSDVPPEIYHSVLYSESVGGSLHQNVKGRYDYRRQGKLKRAAQRVIGR